MNITIRQATNNDLPECTKLLQKIYQDTYSLDSVGLTKACFSEEIFNTKNTQAYLCSNLQHSDSRQCWLAFDGTTLIGSVSIIERDSDYELRGFYVKKEYQHKGIGKQLWQRIREFAKQKDIVCDIYAHNIKTIDLYKKWGFQEDTVKGEFYRHWPEWPEGLQAKCIYMRYSNSK